jgi:Histone H3 K4-specific methyltransferase SET7 N-terminal
MKNDHSVALRSAECSIISAALTDVSPDEIVAEQDRFGFIHRNISTGPPDRRFDLADQVEINLVAASEVPRTAARINENIVLPRRTGSWEFGPLLYRLAAFFVVAAAVLAADQSQAQSSQQGSRLVGTFAADPAYQGSSVALSADGNTAIVGGIVDNKLTGAVWVFTRSGTGWAQQGSKLVGTDAVGQAGQGISVALSADGNTAVVGGPYDNRSTGAAWVFNRNGGVWTQQGSKLVGTGAVEVARQGTSVALSADGNTAIVGGPYDNSFIGAVWVYTRSGDIWTQQGSKLVGTGAVESARQGTSVALSADGNTAIVGGPYDNSFIGAVWVYTRSGDIWTQQGSKLVGTGAVESARQGTSVALSADGNTAIVGAVGDNSYAGAAWVFTRSGTVWTQQGSKLVGTGSVGNVVGQGFSVALSADGNTAILGGAGDNSYSGAVWVYTRSGDIWTQQGSKLVGTGAVGYASQGHSVALSADGNTAIISGPHDNSYTGAAWVYTRSGTAWTQQGSKLVGTGAVGSARQGSSIALSADGNTAIVGGISDNRLAGASWVHSRSGTVWTQQFLGF